MPDPEWRGGGVGVFNLLASSFLDALRGAQQEKEEDRPREEETQKEAKFGFHGVF